MRSIMMGLAAIILTSVVAPAAAQSQIQTYYHAGMWDAFSGRNGKSGAVCGISNTDPSDNRRLAIRFDIGGTDTQFSVSKPGWAIPNNTRITVVMQVGLNPPWTEQGTGHGTTIDWSMNGEAVPAFYRQFRAASSMTLTFPDGNEPPWTELLAGSSAIADTLDRCVRDLTRQVQAAGGAAPPANAAPGPTQPFAPASAAAPDNTAAPPASDTQPVSPAH